MLLFCKNRLLDFLQPTPNGQRLNKSSCFVSLLGARQYFQKMLGDNNPVEHQILLVL
jgi:hypothetical protein